MTINNLPADEKQEINRDLQNLNYNITVGEKNLNQFIDSSALDISADFFQNEGRFPGTQDLIILPKPEIPNFLRKHDILSTNDLFKKISSSVAHGLVSINALAALNMYHGGMSTVSKNAMSEFLHNMSYQALNIENDEIFIKFNGIAQLINDNNETLIERNNQSIQISDVMNTNILNEINNYKFIFDVPTEMEIQDNVDKMIKKEIKPPSPPPRYTPPPELMDKIEIDNLRQQLNEEFLRTAITISKTELDAANKRANEKNKELIKSIVNPTPNLLTETKIKPEDKNIHNNIKNKIMCYL